VPPAPPGATIKLADGGGSSNLGEEFRFSAVYWDELAPEPRNSWACIGRAETLSMYHDYAIGVVPPPHGDLNATSYYSYKTCGPHGACLHLWHQTSVVRTRGWHEFVISANSTAGVVWEIDGQQVGAEPFSTEVRAEGMALRGQRILVHVPPTVSHAGHARAREPDRAAVPPKAPAPAAVAAGGWNVSFGYTDSPLNHGWELVDGTADVVKIDTHTHVVKPGVNSLLFTSQNAGEAAGEWSQLHATRWGDLL